MPGEGYNLGVWRLPTSFRSRNYPQTSRCFGHLLSNVFTVTHFAACLHVPVTAGHETVDVRKAMENILITGGAGFIGSNLAARLLEQGHLVTVYDNLSRPGAALNLGWLQEMENSAGLQLVQADLADYEALRKAAESAGRIYHLAGQVAVTNSVVDPRKDFVDNALGTFNVLEAARQSDNDPIVIYASTNKVYGGMEEIAIEEMKSRYCYVDLNDGVPESMPLDFHSPYGCSKGAGDQYARDYYRIYGLKTVVMRQSCVYGYRQFGFSDQGWLAWFIIAALTGKPIVVYGDGKQVRDVLFIDDLLNAYDSVVEEINITAGEIYNVGGGPGNTVSIWSEFGPILSELMGREIPVTFEDWRPGDQQVYISDIGKLQRDLGWEPVVRVNEGVSRLFEWVQANLELFDDPALGK